MAGGFVQPALLQAIAESLGISRLEDDAAGVLAPDLEYILREVLQVPPHSLRCRPFCPCRRLSSACTL